MAELVRVDPIAAGSRHVLTRAGVVIGRARSCEIQIADVMVSRRHVRIVCSDEGWTLEDLGSINGCFLNGRPVQRAPLRERDQLRIGGYVFELVASNDLVPPPDGGDPGSGAPATAQLLLS